MKKKITHYVTSFFLFGGFLVVATLLFTKHNIAVSGTPSLKHSVFLVSPDKDVKKNDVVTFRYKGDDIYAYKKNQWFTKIIKCSGGDFLYTVVNKEKGNKYYCNESFIGQAKSYDMENRKIESFVFNGYIKKGQFFMYGTHEYSYDSRYWGLMDKSQIVGLSKGLL